MCSVFQQVELKRKEKTFEPLQETECGIELEWRDRCCFWHSPIYEWGKHRLYYTIRYVPGCSLTLGMTCVRAQLALSLIHTLSLGLCAAQMACSSEYTDSYGYAWTLISGLQGESSCRWSLKAGTERRLRSTKSLQKGRSGDKGNSGENNPLCFSPVSKVLILCLLL